MVTATDEDELAARIRKAEEENAEVRKLMFFLQASANISHSSFVIHDRMIALPQVDGDEDDDEQVGMGGNKDVGSGSEDDEDDKKKGSGDEDGSDEE